MRNVKYNLEYRMERGERTIKKELKNKKQVNKYYFRIINKMDKRNVYYLK
jgi:hypothetical protein